MGFFSLFLFQQRQITQFNDIIGGLTDMITNAKEEWEGEQSLGELVDTVLTLRDNTK